MIYSNLLLNRALYLKKNKFPYFYWRAVRSKSRKIAIRQAVTLANQPQKKVPKKDPKNFEPPAGATTGPYADYYKMDHKRRGLALIFCNVKNEIETKESHKDRDDLSRLFKELKFDVEIHNDLTYKKTEDALIAASKKDHSDADCLVVIALSHGVNETIWAKDDKWFPASTLWTHFDATSCPTLAGKPKMVFIQACRGRVGTADDFGGRVLEKHELQPRTYISESPESSERFYTIPTMADILVMYATVEGHYALFSYDQGSFFMQSLVFQMRSRYKNYNLLTILTFVTRQVAIDYLSHYPKYEDSKQICSVVSMLTRLVKFSSN